jgi:predicted RNA-binding protein with TRAM domain
MSYGQRSGGYGARRSFGGGFGGPRNFAPKPVKAGDEYDVEITEISRRGDGIAKIQGFIIFVTGAKTGQKLKVKITNVSNRYATAEIVSPTENAPSQPAEAPASTDAEPAGQDQ